MGQSRSPRQCQAGCDCCGCPESVLGLARRCRLAHPGPAGSVAARLGLSESRLGLWQVLHFFPPVSGSSHPSYLWAGMSSRLAFCIPLAAWTSLSSLQPKLPQTGQPVATPAQVPSMEGRGTEAGLSSDKLAPRSVQWRSRCFLALLLSVIPSQWPRLLGDASSYPGLSQARRSHPEWRRKHSKHPAVVGILKDNQLQGSPACSACLEPRVTGPTSQRHAHPRVPAQMTHPADLTAPTPLLAPRSQGSSPKPVHAIPGYPPHVPSSGLTLCPEGVASLRVKGHSRAALLYRLSGGVSPHGCLLSSGAEARC